MLASIVTLTAVATGAQQAPPAQLPAPPDVAAAPPDAIVTASGLASKVLTPGLGTEHPTLASTVKVHYSGWTPDGQMFDSSVVRGEPSSFGVTRVIRGWTEGVQLMVKGEKRRFGFRRRSRTARTRGPARQGACWSSTSNSWSSRRLPAHVSHLSAYYTHKTMTAASPYKLIPWQSIGPSTTPAA